MQFYVIPTSAPRLSDRHEYLGPYSNTANGRALAESLVVVWTANGIPCAVITSATPPEHQPARQAKLAAVAPQRGLRLEILTGRFLAANGGISTTTHSVTLVDPALIDGEAALATYGQYMTRLSDVTDDAPAVKLAQTRPGYLVLRPAQHAGSGNAGWMASGAYAVSDDQRFVKLTGSPRPLPLHDRTESAELYRMLSD